MKPLSRRHVLTAAALLPAFGATAQSPPPVGGPAEVVAELPGARLQGTARLRFMGLQIYDARLWVGSAPLAADWVATPFALELQYARNFSGTEIAERSLKEMRRQGDINDSVAERWLGNMKQLFPDVKPGDRITGLNMPGTGVRFFVNGQFRGDPRDVEFARTFFGIWLSPRTSEPAMREELLGKKAS